MQGETVAKDEEKAEVLNAFFAANSEVVVQTLSPLSSKTGMGSRRKLPKPKGKWSVTCYTT